MKVCEALWFKNVLPGFSVEELSPLVNIGSSTNTFREMEQPHIYSHIFRLLEEMGVKVIHSDIKQAEGVDVVGNIFDDEALQELKDLNPKSLICANMFEHIEDRQLLADRLMEILPEGGLFFITVPNSYHHHADPIDTMYRPSPEELALLFPNQDILQTELLTAGTYWGKIKQRPFTLFFRHFFRFFIPFVSWEKWKRSMRKLYWLFHHYKVSALVGRKASM